MLMINVGFIISLAMGLYFISAAALRLPTFSHHQAMFRKGVDGRKKVRLYQRYLGIVSTYVSGYLTLDPYRKSKLQKSLQAAEIDETAEYYVAYALTASISIAVLGLMLLAFLPLLLPFLLLLAVAVYFKAMRRTNDLLEQKRALIERELPRFVQTITQALMRSRDVLTMIESYKKSCSKDFKAALDILTADMRSSSYEAALTRFEAKVNSPLLSDVVRGLIGVLRGDDQVVYFQMLAHDMKQLELSRLKKEALKVPSKIRVFSFMMLICFMLMYGVVIGYDIVIAMQTLF